MKQNEMTKNLKIIHVVQHLAAGEIETLVLDQIRFSPPDTQVFVLSLEGEKQQAISNWPKLAEFSENLIFLEKKPGVQADIILTLARIFSIIQPDVVHTHHIGPLLYAGAASMISKVPCRIHTEHDVWHLSNKKHTKMQKLALHTVKPVLVGDANSVSKALRSLFCYRNTITIKNGIDCETFKPGCQKRAREKFDLPISSPVIGCAGRLEKVKGQDILIKALTRLPSNVTLAIAGHGSRIDALKALSHKLSVDNRVIFLGLIEDMASFYQALDLFCLPSRMEGFPLSSLEAQACNIKSIVSDVGASKETLCPKTGRYFEANNSAQLAEIISSSLEAPITDLPREFVLRQHDVRNMVNAYHSIMSEALSC